MIDTPRSSDARVIDVIYAVVLGEGFFSGMYEIKEELMTGQIELLGTGGQSLYRVLLGLFIVILSWLYYRRFMMIDRDYPTSEFTVDIIVMIAYMALFLFINWPVGYYSIVAMIWLLYLLARALSRKMNMVYLIFGLAFVAYFIVAAVSVSIQIGVGAEWLRLILVTIGVGMYRLLDRRLQTRFRFI